MRRTVPRPTRPRLRRQGPGAYGHEVKRERIVGADRHRHDVVDDEIGEYEEVAIVEPNPLGAFFAESRDKPLVEPVDLALAVFAPHRDPLRHRTPPRRLVFKHRVSITEITRFSFQGHRRQPAIGCLQIVEVSGMRGERVIAVDRVFGQKLPVGAHRIFLRAADDGHAGLRLVSDDIEIFLYRTEIGVERLGIPVEADEAEVAIDLKPRNLLHVGCAALLEIRRVGGFAGLAAQRTVQAEHPAVLKALEGFCIAMLLATDLRAAMRTGVEHGAQCSLGIAREQDTAAADLTRDEVAGLGKLGSVA